MQIGSTNTTEVPGLAFALRRPAIACTARFMSSQRALRTARVSVPDEPSLLGLKTLVRTVRDEFRDCEDIWRCLEILNVSGRGDDFKTDPAFNAARTVLAHQMVPNGTAMAKLLDRTAPPERTDVVPESPHSSAASPDRAGTISRSWPLPSAESPPRLDSDATTLQSKHRFAGTAIAGISKIKPSHDKRDTTGEVGPRRGLEGVNDEIGLSGESSEPDHAPTTLFDRSLIERVLARSIKL